MPKHYKEMMDEIINKMDESSNVMYKLVDKKTGKVVFTGKYNQVVQKDKETGYKHKVVTEDAPVNSVAGGGVDLAPNAAVSQSPHMIKRKKEQGAEQEKIKDKIKKMVQNNEDNNNIVFKQVLDGLDKVDTKIDELSYGKTEIKEVEKKEYKTFKDKYNG